MAIKPGSLNELIQAISQDRWNDVSGMIKAQPDLINMFTEVGKNPLIEAARNGAPEELLLQLIEQANKDTINSRDGLGVTILHLLASRGFISALDRALEISSDKINAQDWEEKLKIDILATDRHPMVAKTMREKYPNIRHEYDIWHLAKSVRKRLAAAGKKHKELQQWEKGIINHLWWSAETCQGNETQLLERWTSILRHIVDDHEWICGTEYLRCDHPPLEENMVKPWLISGSDAHQALQGIVTDKLLLRDLKKATCFCHTGNLEVFHNMLLKYLPKRCKFEHEGTIARGYLAVLDNNLTSNREYATLTDKEQQYRLEWSKRSRMYVVKRVKKAKVYNFRKDLMKGVFDRAIMGSKGKSTLIKSKLKSLKASRGKKPTKAEAVAAHMSRIDKHN